jgi:surface polysaccharide O-acyltransferase-like enzyme
MSSTMERNHKLDFLRAVSIICVLIIHCVVLYEPTTAAERVIGGWLEMVTRPCIAVFLFISGYLFKTNLQDSSYLWKKYKRVIMPYLFFCLVTLLSRGRSQIVTYIMSKPIDLIIDILLGNIWGIYYFVFVIVFLYTLAFIILRNPKLRTQLIPLTLLLFVVNLLQGAYYYPIVDTFNVSNSRLAILYSERFILSWPAFFFLGILFKKYNGQVLIERHSQKVIFFWVFIFTFYNCLYFIGIENIYEYNSVIGTFYSLTTIAALLLFNIKNKIIDFLSEVSYSIYLSHVFFVAELKLIGDDLGIEWSLLSWIIVSFFVSLIGSLILYLIAKLIFKQKSYLIIGA